MMNDKSSKGSNPHDDLAFRVAYLIRGFIQEELTEREHQELDDWICSSRKNQELFEEMIDEKHRAGWEKWKQQLPVKQREASAKAKIAAAAAQEPASMRSMFPWLAAAAVILLLLITWTLFQKNKTKKNIPIETTRTDIPPGSNRASLQLSDGSLIALDGLHRGNITRQGNVDIIKKDSEVLSYQITRPAVANEKPVYNILTTPRGGQYKVILPDGTGVWLNAVSSLTYPTAFAGKERKVVLTGEAYFEVTKDPEMPFVVEANGTAIRVLGTHFNVHAYNDEPLIKVSLTEGSVNVSQLNGNRSKLLSPGQQARVDASGSIKVVAADLHADLAWKNGQFIFKEAPLQEIMKQLERWYDADINYTADIQYHFNAEISRSVPVSKLLELLEQTESVHFKIENKKITVMK